LYNGEEFEISVEIESSYAGNATVRLFEDSEITQEKSVSLQKGNNKFIFRDIAKASGVITYMADVVADEDDSLRNNKMYTFIKVLGTPQVLIVDGTGSESHELVKILDGIADCDVVTPEMVPSTLEKLRHYDSVILMNTPYDRLPKDWDTLLEVFVRQLGRGVLTVGGDQA
jgi:hypothetical protein